MKTGTTFENNYVWDDDGVVRFLQRSLVDDFFQIEKSIFFEFTGEN